jgi:CRISPR-associated protein Cmr4
MFQASKALFIYCVSPVHMGAGTAIGLIDNPIQRERHTEYPMIAGSGLKGAVRHRFQADGWDQGRIARIFGPETNASDHAGAISFGDAQLVAFPVRCTRQAYVYATSPTALARAARTLALVGANPAWPATTAETGHCKLINPALLNGDKLHLETFEFTAHMDQSLMKISEWISQHALPSDAAYDFFREKLKTDLVLLPDEDFGYFVKNATVVEPHVRINDQTGTADDGGLFYTENLPPESLLLAPLMATAERSGKGAMQANEVLAAVLQGDAGLKGLNGQLVQVGGDATTGRGQVVMTAVG